MIYVFVRGGYYLLNRLRLDEIFLITTI